jgi:hypothetical protein
MDQINFTEELQAVKRGRGRPRIPDEERKPYVQKPRPGYHTKYYYTSGLAEKVKCELCDQEITKQKLRRHQATKKCKQIYCLEVIEL